MDAATIVVNVGETKPSGLPSNIRDCLGPKSGRDFGKHRHSLTYRGAVLNLKRYRNNRPLRPASSCPDIISVATTDDKSIPVSQPRL